jgi:pimeloyl-ACP methyl ester carboxylesterase
MKPLHRRLLLIALLIGALTWQGLHRAPPEGRSAALAVTAAAPDLLRLGRLTLAPCRIGKSRAGVPTLRAYCTTLAVPEDRAQPAGRQIRLKIAVVRAAAARAEPDPVVFLDGGPGGAASDDYPAIAGAFDPLLKRHLVLLVDQRGTGGSNALDCELPDDEPSVGAPAQQALRRCLAKLAQRAAPQFYTTSDAVADLEAVRAAIGSPQLDLIGVSYGTRVAQQYARRYPAAVRAVVLDSAVPNDLALGSEHARNLEAVLRALFNRCRAERGCAERFGDPYRTLQRVRARLAAQPQTLELRDPYTFRTQSKTITAAALAQLVRLYAYSPYTAALLPYVLQEADAGRYAPLLGQAQVAIGDVADNLTGGMGLSVSCAEDADRLQPQAADADTVLGNALIQWLLDACPQWPHALRPAGFGEPLRGDLPVLVLAGEHDPVTPPRYGEAIVRTLPQARLLRVAGQGHAILGVGCMPRLVAEFIRSRDAKTVDAQCLQALAQTPPFLDANGAGP